MSGSVACTGFGPVAFSRTCTSEDFLASRLSVEGILVWFCTYADLSKLSDNCFWSCVVSVDKTLESFGVFFPWSSSSF